MSKTAWAIVAAFVITIGVAANPQVDAKPSTSTRARTHASVNVNDTLRALNKLHSMGYTIADEAHAAKAIRHWQKVNGLTVDGIVGNETLHSLGLSPGAPHSARTSPVTPSAPQPIPQAVTVAPGTPDCQEMSVLRAAVGLPAVFDHLGFRESNCTNTPISRTGCCVGYLQIHKVVFNDNRMKPLIDANCGGVTWFDIRGDDQAAKEAQMCVAKQLYDVVGMSPWSLG